MEMFDFEWYANLVKKRMSNSELQDHYRQIGQFAGLSPSPYFNIAWYVGNLDVALDDYVDPFEHFLQFGSSNLKDPHPLFNAGWYKWSHIPDDDANPLLHYISEGWQAGKNPHPLFWGAWYQEKYLKNAGHIDPFYHFIVEGHSLGHQPNPLFDVRWYIEKYDLGVNENALTNYIYGGHLTRDPHPLFDSNYYRAAVDCGGLSPLEHYLTNNNNISPSIMFDVDYFMKNKARLHLHGKLENYPPLVQYIELWKNTKLDPHPLFSKKYYFEHHPDVKQANVDALYHYARSGAWEGRQPHPLFEPDFYWEQFPETRASNPLADYLSRPVDARARPRRPRAPDTRIKPLPSSRKVVNLRKSEIDTSQDVSALKIGVFAHIFYSDLSEYVVQYTNNIDFDCTIYITTTAIVDAKIITSVFEQNSKHDFVVRIVPNRGRDIAPMLVTYRDALEACDIALHVHSKKSKHYKGGFDDWRDYLFNMNLGSPELVTSIVHTLARSDVGAVLPDHYAPIKPLIQWGGNLNNVKSLISLCGENISDDHVLDLPSGSMFWFKTEALRKLFDLDLRYHHFDPEFGQVDGTLAHAIERAFLLFVEMAGFEWVVHGVGPSLPAVNCSDQSRSIGNRFFPTDRDLGVTRHYYPECTSYMVRPSDVEKPRLNLLIPLIDQNKGYAGIATGIQIFLELYGRLKNDFDARIITTDMSPDNQFVPPDTFMISSALDADVAGVNTVIDGARRYQMPIFFRKNDVLFSTAWWTASGALDIMTQQKDFFGIHPKKFVYLIQDFESGFYAWSTKYGLADRTYRHPDLTIPVFNTGILRDFFVEKGLYEDGYVLLPGINKKIGDHIKIDVKKEKIVLLYARPHADRNCLPFIDMLVRTVTRNDPEIWNDWKFIAIGEDFDGDVLKCTDRITQLGRLTLKEYGDLASRASLAISLMISPHPSYPPLELANAGVLVLTNNYDNKDMSRAHDNIFSFTTFDLDDVSRQLTSLARAWSADQTMGWRGKPKIDWFFNGKSNMNNLIEELSTELKSVIV